MIDYVHGSVYWCMLQVSLLALVGVILSIVAAKRRPAVGCSIACLTVSVTALLTATAPLPVHELFTLQTGFGKRLAGAEKAVAFDHEGSLSSDESGNRVQPALSSIDLTRIAAMLQSVASKADLPDQHSGTAMRVATWCFLGAIVIGLARLICGIAFVLRIRLSSDSVCDCRLLQLASELSIQLGCDLVPVVRESERLSSAAVAGWLRPSLVLPSGWDRWSDEELRAVLAHELAHVVRRDSVWRTIASSVSAMHFYNPLVHWLLRRVMLYQELSADELAASIVGRHSYLHSISRLAIERDNQIRCNGRPDCMPVFSGNLIRRISMLRSKEGTLDLSGKPKRSLRPACAFAAIILLGMTTVALRGFAQVGPAPDEDTDPPAERVARARSTDKKKPLVDPTLGMFRRPPLDPAVIAENNTGMVVIRLREWLERPELRPYIPAINSSLSSWFETEFPGAGLSSIDIESIDWIAGKANLSLRTVEVDSGEGSHRLMFGAGGFVVRLRQPIDMNDCIERHFPEAKHYVVEGQDVFELPVTPSLGPLPMCVAMRDDGTLLATPTNLEITAETTIRDIFQVSLAEDEKNKSRWVSAWNRIEGGLGSVVFTDAEIYEVQEADHTDDEFAQAVEKLARVLYQRCSSFAYGLDATHGASVIGIRLRLTHSSHGPATKSAQQIREFIELAKSESLKKLTAEEPESTKTEKELHALLDKAIQGVVISTEELEDGFADVIISATVPFEQVVTCFAQAAKEESASESGEE